MSYLGRCAKGVPRKWRTTQTESSRQLRRPPSCIEFPGQTVRLRHTSGTRKAVGRPICPCSGKTAIDRRKSVSAGMRARCTDQITHCHFQNLPRKVASPPRVGGSMTNTSAHMPYFSTPQCREATRALPAKGIALSAFVLPTY